MPASRSDPKKAAGQPLTLSLPHLELAAKVWGPPDGAYVLALHGWLDNAASFDALAPLLAGLRIVALDLPGHGLSDHYPSGQSYAFIDTVADVCAAIKALGWGRYSLLGHSLGAGIAPLIAGTFPEQVERLALIEGLGPLGDTPSQVPERFARSLAYQAGRTTKKRVFPDLDAAAAKRTAASPMLVSSARTLAERGMVRDDAGYTWRADPRLRVPSRIRLSHEQIYAFLERIVCPTLLIHSQGGFEDAREHVRTRIQRVKDIEVVKLPGQHHVHLDDPSPVAEQLNAFFAPIARA